MKHNERQEMVSQIQEIASGLGFEMKFDDEKLDHLSGGKLLTFGQLKEIAAKDEPVWLYYKDYDGSEINCPQIASFNDKQDCIIFHYGSFGLELELDQIPIFDDDEVCDFSDGYGSWSIYEAIAAPQKSAQETLTNVANALKDASVQIRAIAKGKRATDEEKYQMASAILQVFSHSRNF